MMGRTHAAVGAATWLAVAPLEASWTHHPIGVAALAWGVAVAAGAGLLPDIDHPNASIAHTFPIVSEPLAEFIGKVSGGHRHATHTVVATATVTAGMWGLGVYDRYTALAAVLLLVAFAAHTGRTMRRFSAILFACGLAALVVRWAPPGRWEPAWAVTRLHWAVAHVPPGPWLPAAVGVGYLSHLVVDMINQPLPMFLWPLRTHVGIRGFRVQTFPEYVFAACVTTAFWWMAYGAFAPTLTHWSTVSHVAR